VNINTNRKLKMPNDKDLEDLSKEEVSKLKIEFAPGCFDNFEGTQEELDELVAEIHRMVSSGELQEKARKLDPEDLSDEDMELLLRALDVEQEPRKLQ
jgi:hypothetical protein